MVLGRRGFTVLLLVGAATMFCLMLLSTSSSGAQERTTAPTGDTVAGDGCDVIVGATDGAQQSSANGDEGDGGLQPRDQNGSNDFLAGGSDNGGQPALQAGAGIPSSDAGGNGGDECDDVVADTVPDELLPPTGAPVKSQTVQTAEKDGKSGYVKKKKADSSQKKINLGEKLQTNDRPAKESAQEKPEDRSKPATGKRRASETSEVTPSSHEESTSSDEPRGSVPDSGQKKPETFARSASEPDLAPALAADWSRPVRKEVAAANKPRSFAPDPGTEMTLSARALGLYNVPIASSRRTEDLDNGLIRMPDSSLPWDSGDQKNVYIAGHYLGLAGTPSRLIFYNLNKLKTGDELVLKDDQGRPYKYRVSEKFEVGPEASWVMGQARNRDMVTLQTCIPPDFGKRLVVRADRKPDS